MRQREGLCRSDALAITDVACEHEKWNRLNAAIGCIHPDHGPYPPALVDHHTGVRLVHSIPTRYLTSEAADGG